MSMSQSIRETVTVTVIGNRDFSGSPSLSEVVVLIDIPPSLTLTVWP